MDDLKVVEVVCYKVGDKLFSTREDALYYITGEKLEKEYESNPIPGRVTFPVLCSWLRNNTEIVKKIIDYNHGTF